MPFRFNYNFEYLKSSGRYRKLLRTIAFEPTYEINKICVYVEIILFNHRQTTRTTIGWNLR